MKNNKKIKLLCVLIAIVIIFAIVIAIIVSKTNVKIITCKSSSNSVTITFKGNKIHYIKGNIKMVSGYDKDDNLNKNLELYHNLINYDYSKNTVKYSMYYNKDNEGALNFVGFNYNNSPKYKDVIKNLEDNNYYCE